MLRLDIEQSFRLHRLSHRFHIGGSVSEFEQKNVEIRFDDVNNTAKIDFKTSNRQQMS